MKAAQETPARSKNTALLAASIASFIVVVGAWIACWVLLRGDCDRGTFGDMFGSVNALFSGLAFAGVIIAILLQRQELQLQRTELELTRGELKKSAQAQQGSMRALEQQIETARGSARLSALTGLLDHWSRLLSASPGSSAVKKKAQEYAALLEDFVQSGEIDAAGLNKALRGIEVGTVAAGERPLELLRMAEDAARVMVISLRIEIEKKLRRLASAAGIDSRGPLNRVLTDLVDREVIAENYRAPLVDLIRSGNQAAQGAGVAPDAAEWTNQKGQAFLATLEDFIVQVEKEGNLRPR